MAQPTWFQSMVALKKMAGEYCPKSHPFLIDATTLEEGTVIASFGCNDCHYMMTFSTEHSRIKEHAYA